MFPVRRISIVIAVLAFSVFSLPADEGRKPLPECPTCDSYFVINQPGSYYLTASFREPGAAIVVEASNVEINLNGFSIENTAPKAFQTVVIKNADNVTIRNGTILGSQRAIYGQFVNGLVLEDLKTRAGSFANIDLKFVDRFTIRRVIMNSGVYGIFARAFTGTTIHGIIEDCQLAGMYHGITLGETVGTTVRNNRIRTIDVFPPGGNPLIYFANSSGCSITGNTLENSNSSGIGLLNTSNCLVEHNVMSDMENNGIWVLEDSSEIVVRYNIVKGSRLAGIRIDGDRNRIEDNMTNTHWLQGLRFGPNSENNLYRGVSGFGIGNVPPPCAGPGATRNFCDEGVGNVDGGGNILP